MMFCVGGWVLWGLHRPTVQGRVGEACHGIGVCAGAHGDVDHLALLLDELPDVLQNRERRSFRGRQYSYTSNGLFLRLV